MMLTTQAIVATGTLTPAVQQKSAAVVTQPVARPLLLPVSGTHLPSAIRRLCYGALPELDALAAAHSVALAPPSPVVPRAVPRAAASSTSPPQPAG